MAKSKKSVKQVDKIIDYQLVFGTEAGKLVLHDLMLNNHLLSPTMDKCPYETAFNEGKRNAILRIMTILKQDPSELMKFLEEREEEGDGYV